jgi:hypothetical protein
MYGEYLGQRYKDTPNIMWIVGGDNDAKGEDEPYMRNLVEGIKTYDENHLWTGHFSNTFGNFWSTDNPLYRDMIDIDGLYVWKEISLGDRGPQYVTELAQYRKGKMIVQLDQSYEHDVPHYADNENPQWIRRKMYHGLLSGCAGTSFSSGTLDTQAYWFKNWQAVMHTPGMKQVSMCFHLFDALPWQDLIPDTTDTVIVEGRGAFGSLDYIGAAKPSLLGSVRECRGRLAADDGGCLVDEFVILKGLHHEQGKIYTARQVAREEGGAHVPAPHRQTLAFSLFEVAPTHDRPQRVAGEHPPARFHLVVEVREADEPRKPAEDLHERPEFP